MSHKELCFPYHFDREKLVKVKALCKVMGPKRIEDCFERMKPNTYFVAEGGGIPAECTYHLTVLRLENSLYVYNNEVIVKKQQSDVLHNHKPSETDWRQLFNEIGPKNLDINHYHYLEIVIEDFWKRVFGKTLTEMWCGGIITSHGDKAYGYKSDWEENNIPFNRGVLIFLLTYTKELGDRPKHESCEWVAENYDKYLPHILEAERLAGI